MRAERDRSAGGVAATARAGLGSPASIAEGGGVPVPDDGVRRNPLALVRLDADCAAVLDHDPRDALSKSKLCATSSRQFRQRLGEARHAAFNNPNALTLDVSDQHESRRSEEWR